MDQRQGHILHQPENASNHHALSQDRDLEAQFDINGEGLRSAHVHEVENRNALGLFLLVKDAAHDLPNVGTADNYHGRDPHPVEMWIHGLRIRVHPDRLLAIGQKALLQGARQNILRHIHAP